MNENRNGHPYEFYINGHKFESENQFVTGSEILKLAGLAPEDDFEILLKLTDKEYEPIELSERVDLSDSQLEHFEVKPVKKLTIFLDDEEVPVPKCFMTPIEILALLNLKSEQYYLKQILGHKEINYKNDEIHVIAIVCGLKFSSCKRGSTPVS